MTSTTLAGANPSEHSDVTCASDYGDVRAEFRSLLSGCGLYDLSARAKIVVTGSDRVRWLNGMATNNVRDLASGHGVYAFLLNAQGRIQADLTAFLLEDSILLETGSEQVKKLLATLDPTFTTPLASHSAVSVRSGPVSLVSAAVLVLCLASACPLAWVPGLHRLPTPSSAAARPVPSSSAPHMPPRGRAQRMTVTRPSDKSGHERSRSAAACRSALPGPANSVLGMAMANGPRGTKGLAAPARLHRHDELTALQPEPGRAETAGGAAWPVAARGGSRGVTSPS